MAYRVRVYAPTDGVNYLAIQNSSGVSLGTVTPQGTSTPCFDQSGLTTGLTITPYLASNASVSRWVVNVDDTIYYQYSTYCSLGYIEDATNVYIRLEVTVTDIYYLTLTYNANGGSGAPYSETFESTSSSVSFTVSTTYPTRDGYTFAGWATYSNATSAQFLPGQSGTMTGSTSGNTIVLYAVWIEDTVTGVVYVNGNAAYPYIYTSSGWKQATPYVYNGSWRSTTV